MGIVSFVYLLFFHVPLFLLGIQAVYCGSTTIGDFVRVVSCLFGIIGSLVQKFGYVLLAARVVFSIFCCQRFIRSTYCHCLACFQTIARRIRKFYSRSKERRRMEKATVKIQSAVRRFLAQKITKRLRDEHKIPADTVANAQRTVDKLRQAAASDMPNYVPVRVYKNFSIPKGYALIINNSRFASSPDRKGADVDERSIRHLWDKLGYNVLETQENLSAELMLDAGRRFAQDSRHSSCHSCIVVVMTHGEYDILYGADDTELDIDAFLGCFSAPKALFLAGKPKLFFIQSCRGSRRDLGFLHEVPEEEADSPAAWRKIASNSDFLVAYSTTPLYNSWRHPVDGSWFIESVCAIFGEHAHSKSITSMLHMVQKRVSEQYETVRNCKQVPQYVSSLTKDFYFFPGVSDDEQ